MAERRMFTKKITDDDHFMALSASAQALYLHLSMCADDDGFNNQISVCMFKAHASVSDLEALLEKRYIYQFDNGVIVIKHWRMANALRKDRYTPTAFQEELGKLGIKDNGSYTLLSECENDDGCRLVATWLPQDRLGKDSIDKDRERKKDIKKEKTRHKYGSYKNVLLSDEAMDKLKAEFPNDYSERIERVSEYCESTGKTYKNYLATIRAWSRKEGGNDTKGNTRSDAGRSAAGNGKYNLQSVCLE